MFPKCGQIVGTALGPGITGQGSLAIRVLAGLVHLANLALSTPNVIRDKARSPLVRLATDEPRVRSQRSWSVSGITGMMARSN
jgi:hypothetical protein